MNSEFQKRLFQFQAAPPARSWNEIAAALEEETPGFARRLFRYQVPPAKAIWSKITGRLAEGTGAATTVSMRRKWLGYAAAAIILALAGFGTYLVLSGDHSQPTIPAAVTPVVTVPAPAPHTAIVEKAAATDTLAQTASPGVPHPASRKTNITRHLTARLAPTVRKLQPAVDAAKNEVLLPEKTIVNASRADRYMIATAYDGSVVRLPKKAYAAFACVDVPDIGCREKIASMQNKMAAASLTTDFAGFLDLLNNLQDQ